MHIHRINADSFEIQAPAKINLFLQVMKRREDGYHELRTLMACIGLCDTLTLQAGRGHDRLTCSDSRLPMDASNLVNKALSCFNDALTRETQIIPKKIFIHLEKRIPMGAGLGGGSSNAAAVLNCLNRYYDHPFGQGQLKRMALTLGADVPFFVDGMPALATGVGEVLSPYSQLSPWGVVVIYPGFGISTAEVFKNLNLGLTKCEKQLRYSPFKHWKFKIGLHLCNDLETVAAKQFPVIEEIKKDLLKQGAMGSLMTGSGSAVFGLFADLQTAREAANRLGTQSGWQVFAAELLC